MFRAKKYLILIFILLAALTSREAATARQAPAVKSVEVSPAIVEAEVGQQVKFKASGKDETGKTVDEKPSVWFAAPSDLGGADETGTVTLYNPGVVMVGAMIGGKVGFAKINVKPARVSRIEVDPVTAPLVAGSVVRLGAVARIASGDPRADAVLAWSSDNPAVATVDRAGVVTALKPGRATLRVSSEAASGTVGIEVIANPARSLAIEPKAINARTGDVVRFRVEAKDGSGAPVKSPAVRWAVSGDGSLIEADGGFVAERPGTYIVTAASGDQTASASVVVTPRNVEREVEIVGRAKLVDMQAAEQWIIGNYAYLSTIWDKLNVYDVSDPANPRLTGSLQVDARLINDISTTADGRIGVISREGASDRRNGIAFLDLADPAHPKIISEFTDTVTGGVHSAFIDGHYVYLTDDATGSLRVIDFKDVRMPKEVGRWQTETALGKPILQPTGGNMAGRYLHDVQVKDGLAYLAYWRDGLIILDVGNGIKGGRPEAPKLVSQFRFNHHELYGPGWTAGSHAVFRYKNYVFVGDEVFPIEFDIYDRARFAVRGIVHVIDVSDITAPRRVAEYVVPEAGSHNIWVENDVMYMGYYTGGGRIVDVSGELRGDLYRQGREIARVWTGDPNGFRPNMPFTWGAQPHKGVVFFNDINSGLWIVKLGELKDKGSTTAPGN